MSLSDSLTCKCNNSPFADRHHTHILAGHLRTIGNKFLRNLFIKIPKYKLARPINAEKPNCCILKVLDIRILSCCYKNGVDKSFLFEWTNNFTFKIDERRSHLTNKLYTSKYRDHLYI